MRCVPEYALKRAVSPVVLTRKGVNYPLPPLRAVHVSVNNFGLLFVVASHVQLYVYLRFLWRQWS